MVSVKDEGLKQTSIVCSSVVNGCIISWLEIEERDWKKLPQKCRFLKPNKSPFGQVTTVENNLNERRFDSKLVCWTATMYTYMKNNNVPYGGTCNNVH